MGCLFDKEIIHRYADNTIDPLEYIFLKEHISYCDECRKETELVMTLESGLEEYFVDDPGPNRLDLMIAGLVDDCMYELNKREKLKYAVNKCMKLGSGIMNNSLRFMEYIPGRKSVNKGIQKTASGAGSFLKGLLKKKAGRLFAGGR